MQEDVFEFSLALIEVYFLCFLALKKTETVTISKAKSQVLAYQLRIKYDFRSTFFRHLSDPHSFDMPYVVAEMNRSKDEIQNVEHMYNSEHWGDMCFTMFLLFEILAKPLNRSSEWLNDAFNIYKNSGAERAKLCQQFLNKGVIFDPKVVYVVKKQFNIEKLLSEEKKVAKFTKLGILSVALTDATQ